LVCYICSTPRPTKLTSTVASLAVPLLHVLDPVSHYLHRLLIIFLTFAPTFVLLTISYEGLFYVAFCITLLAWVRLEHLIHQRVLKPTVAIEKVRAGNDRNGTTSRSSKDGPVALQSKTSPSARPTYRALSISDTRPSLFTLYLLQSAFFSTGNIASVSSFSLDAVYRLIPVFDPFSQGALLVLKILVPFVLLSATLGILNKRLGMAPGALFMGLVVLGDWLTVNFFWMVRDEGSWLEIGETISRFCIVSALAVFVAALEGGSAWLVGDVDEGEEVLNHGVADAQMTKVNLADAN
jgi:phosphatidylinositol glycan class N